MTYGEAVLKARDNMDIKDGLAYMRLPKFKRFKSKKEALEYYNRKLFKYWLNQFYDAIPDEKKEKVLNYLLGRRNERDG